MGSPAEDWRLDAIELRDISHAFPVDGGRLSVLEGLGLSVPSGEVVCVVGPNGCGKSTLLRVIAGLITPTDGTVAVYGQVASGPDERVGLVFQEPRLLPWRRLLANVAYPLELGGVARDEREQRARDAIERLGLTGFEEAYPDELSGGMAQRAGIARSIVDGPGVLLLDEPFSALDALTREQLDVELLHVWQERRPTIVLVTHSIPEAVLVADRVLVMSPRPGRVVADIRVEAVRPRSPADLDTAALAEASRRIRTALETPREAAA